MSQALAHGSSGVACFFTSTESAIANWLKRIDTSATGTAVGTPSESAKVILTVCGSTATT
jgi:hypothetical protein